MQSVGGILPDESQKVRKSEKTRDLVKHAENLVRKSRQIVEEMKKMADQVERYLEAKTTKWARNKQTRIGYTGSTRSHPAKPKPSERKRQDFAGIASGHVRCATGKGAVPQGASSKKAEVTTFADI